MCFLTHGYWMLVVAASVLVSHKHTSECIVVKIIKDARDIREIATIQLSTRLLPRGIFVCILVYFMEKDISHPSRRRALVDSKRRGVGEDFNDNVTTFRGHIARDSRSRAVEEALRRGSPQVNLEERSHSVASSAAYC